MTKRLIIATLASAVVLTACNKGTISSKRLDGTWNLTAGEVKTVEDVKNGTSLLYTNTTISKLDGKTNAESFSSTSSNFPASTSNTSYTSKITFDKSNDSYTKVEVMEETSTSTNEYFFSDANCNTVVLGGSIVTTATSTITTKGVYTILGSTGDIESNTRMLLEDNTSTSVSNNTYKYMNGTATLSAAYESNNGCKALPLADTKTTTTADVTAMGQIITVKESTKSEMTMDINTKSTYTSGNYSTTSTTTGTTTYTKE